MAGVEPDALQAVVSAAATSAALEKVGGAVAGALWKKGSEKVFGSTEAKALVEPVLRAFARAIGHSREVPSEDWGEDDWQQWWEGIGQTLLEAFSSPKAARRLAVAALTFDEPWLGAEQLRDELEQQGLDVDKLETEYGLDVDELFRVLPGTLTDELMHEALADDSPLGEKYQLVALRRIAEAITADEVAPLSPLAARDQLRDYLTKVVEWTEERMREVPYLEHAPDVDRLDQVVQMRVGLRREVDLRQSEEGDVTQSGRAAAARYYPLASHIHAERASLDWDEAMRRYERLVVLADPGLGKSWSLYRHARTLAHDGIARIDERVPPASIVVPVLARCDALGSTGQHSLSDAAVQVLAQRHTLTPSFRAWLRQQGAAGNAAFLLDALDETTLDQRNALSGQARRWLAESPAGASQRLVVTSRIAGNTRQCCLGGRLRWRCRPSRRTT